MMALDRFVKMEKLNAYFQIDNNLFSFRYLLLFITNIILRLCHLVIYLNKNEMGQKKSDGVFSLVTKVVDYGTEASFMDKCR